MVGTSLSAKVEYLSYTHTIYMYCIIPYRSTGCFEKSSEEGYIRFREPGTTETNMIYKRNQPIKLVGASIRRGAFIGDNTVHAIIRAYAHIQRRH